jgi:hypothetical protein
MMLGRHHTMLLLLLLLLLLLVLAMVAVGLSAISGHSVGRLGWLWLATNSDGPKAPHDTFCLE